MHNPLVYRAKFSGLIITVFGLEQTLSWSPEIEMYQMRDSPALWGARPKSASGQFKWEAADPAALARIIEESFVQRLSAWQIIRPEPLFPRPAKPTNVVWIDSKRRA